MRQLITLINLVLVVFLFFSCSEGEQGRGYPVAAVMPIRDIYVFEDHSEVLIHWLKRGYKDEILVNIDQHDDLRYIPEYKIERLKKLAKNKQWEEISKAHDIGVQSLFTLADFIYAAQRLGIVKRLYWVSPSGFLKGGDIQRMGRAFLKAFGYSDEIVKTFVKDGDTIHGKIYGLDVIISSIDNLPKIKEPVLLTIDVDYFPNSIRKEDAGELYILRRFFNALSSKGIQVKDLTISYSVNGGYTEAFYRYIGDEVEYLFRHPDVVKNGNFPELWTLREQGLTLLRKGSYKDAIMIFDKALNLFKDDASILAGKAVALSRLDMHKESMELIERLLKTNPEYVYLYINIAREVGEKKMLSDARKYLDEFLKYRPDSYYGLIAYGDILYANARDQEALRYYQRVLKLYEDVNATMYAGDTLFHMRRFQEAVKYYKKGLELISQVGYRSMRDYPESVRNMKYLGMI